MSKIPSSELVNYEICESLGQGAFAVVKRAVHLKTGEIVAIKIIDKSKLDEGDLDNVEKEINVMKKLKHPNIIQLYEVIETADNIYLVMELAENGDFFDLITENEKLDESSAKVYFSQIISAIEYYHKLNIAHRDLKPENVFVDFRKSIKIADFGLSTIYSSDKLLSTPCGTPNYAPPEMMRGEEYHGLFSDIWSCGVMLYSMLCGYLPFGESNENILCQHILSGEIEIPNDLSNQAIDLIKNMLNIDPLVRIDIDEIKEHPWMEGQNISTLEDDQVVNQYFPVDSKIIDLMRLENEEERKKVEIAVKKNEFSELTTFYYLTVKKCLKEGIKSPSVFYSNEYFEYVESAKGGIESKNVESVTQKGPKISYIQPINSKKSCLLESKDLIRKSIYHCRKTGILPQKIEIIDKDQISRKSMMRFDGGKATIFLHLLEKQVLNEGENQSNESKIDEFRRKKTLIESYQRSSVYFSVTKQDNVIEEDSDSGMQEDSIEIDEKHNEKVVDYDKNETKVNNTGVLKNKPKKKVEYAIKKSIIKPPQITQNDKKPNIISDRRSRNISIKTTKTQKKIQFVEKNDTFHKTHDPSINVTTQGKKSAFKSNLTKKKIEKSEATKILDLKKKSFSPDMKIAKQQKKTIILEPTFEEYCQNSKVDDIQYLSESIKFQIVKTGESIQALKNERAKKNINQINPNQIIENFESNFKVLDIGFIFQTDMNTFKNILSKICHKFKVTISDIKINKIYCGKEGVKFKVDIYLLQASLIGMKVKKINGNHQSFLEIISTIVSEFKNDKV